MTPLSRPSSWLRTFIHMVKVMSIFTHCLQDDDQYLNRHQVDSIYPDHCQGDDQLSKAASW